MSLSNPVARNHLHTRQVQCQGFRRADGLWDIEAHMTDVKTYVVENQDRGPIPPGEPVHDMWLRLTLTDAFEITAIEAVTDKSPFSLCPDITGNFQRLVGLSIGAGFTRTVRELLGGVAGCTHLVELLGPAATTAFQTIYPVLSQERRSGAGVPGPDAAPGRRPALINTCHAFAETSPVVARLWPDFHRPAPAASSEGGG
jgi:hypothetical protein